MSILVGTEDFVANRFDFHKQNRSDPHATIVERTRQIHSGSCN